jgi:hypothetical protein
MTRLTDYPLLLLALSFVTLSLAAWIGALLARGRVAERQARDEVFGIVEGATLTLLGLIVGFTFSMAVGRYDQRKNLEEAEANAIGTEYVRADLLLADDAKKVRALLLRYLDERIFYYETRDEALLRPADLRLARLQTDLWSAVVRPATAQPTPVAALAVAGMNDVLNSQGFSQAASLNRIPAAAWCLMVAIAILCNVLVGFDVASTRARLLPLVLPLAISIAFFLIADIESPRGGFIHVSPQNLLSLAQSLRAQ